MPNVSLTKQMQEYAAAEIASGAYANLSEIVRAGMRKLMADRGAAAYFAMKADLEEHMALAEAGKTEAFDWREYEPEAFR